MLTTTGYNFEGYTISRYIKVISEAVVLGTGFLSSASASFADLTGSRSGSYANKLQMGKEEALKRLQEQAKRLGGDAIIGIDIDYTTFSNDVMGIIASGTVVKLENEKREANSLKYSFPSLAYNPYIPFNVCSLNLVQNIFTNATVGSLSVKNYEAENNITAVIVDIELEELFGQTHLISDVIFTCHSIEEGKIYSTDYSPVAMNEIQLNLIRRVYIVAKKYIMNDNGKIMTVNQESYLKNDSLTNEGLRKIRGIYGMDSVCDFKVTEEVWKCYCGAANDINSTICFRCGRETNKVRIKVGSSDATEQIDLEEIIEEASKRNNAKEIYNFLCELNLATLEPLLEELQKVIKDERLWGNMKDTAIVKIEKFIYK